MIGNDRDYDDHVLRSVHAKFIIDTNRINAKGGLENINQLEKWSNNDNIIFLYTPEATLLELSNERNIGWGKKRKQKARQKLIAYPFINADGIYQDIKDENGDSLIPEGEKERDRKVYKEIENILFKKDNNTRNDINIVYTAWETGSILVTADGDSKEQPGGILGNSDKLKDCCGVVIMRDFEAVEYVKKLIKERDEGIRRGFEKNELPCWLGKD